MERDRRAAEGVGCSPGFSQETGGISRAGVVVVRVVSQWASLNPLPWQEKRLRTHYLLTCGCLITLTEGCVTAGVQVGHLDIGGLNHTCAVSVV